MMNDTTKKNNEKNKNTYKNKVCHTLLLGGELEFGDFKFQSGAEEGGVRERGEKQKNIFWEVVLLGRYPGHPFKLDMQDFKNFNMP